MGTCNQVLLNNGIEEVQFSNMEGVLDLPYLQALY